MDSRIWIHRLPSEAAEVDDGQFVVSTRRSHLDLDYINKAFGDDEIFWAKPLALADMNKMLDNSITLGLYKYRGPHAQSEPLTEAVASSLASDRLEQIGMARYITDHITFAYLTDVIISPTYRGRGLGSWLIQCCADVVETMRQNGSLRGIMLVTSNALGVPFYGKHLGAKLHDQSGDLKILLTKDRES